MHRPGTDEYAPFFQTYLDTIPADEVDVLAGLTVQRREIVELIEGLGDDAWGSRYAPGKWTVGQVLVHVCDTEWVLASRALWFARGAAGPLPGVDQDAFMAGNGLERLSRQLVRAQFEHLRGASVTLLRGLDEAAWDRRGEASGSEFTVRALAFVMLGHARHHQRVLRERYGMG